MAGFLAGVLWNVISWDNFHIPRLLIGAVTGSAG